MQFVLLHSASASASFSLLRQSRSPDQIQGEENRLFLFMVEWQGSRRVYGTGNSAVAIFGKYSMPQDAWKNNFETSFFVFFFFFFTCKCL